MGVGRRTVWTGAVEGAAYLHCAGRVLLVEASEEDDGEGDVDDEEHDVDDPAEAAKFRDEEACSGASSALSRWLAGGRCGGLLFACGWIVGLL